PRLIVKTEIRFLAALVSPKVDAKTKEHLKQDLRSLKDFLGILEDNRDRTQGTGIWHFTLKLWHRRAERNLTAFDELWQQRKQAFQKATAQKIAVRKEAEAQKAAQKEIQKEALKETAAEQLFQLYHNLPSRDYGTFIGREQTLQQLATFLAAEHPVSRISLLGPGGIGKTALALESAHRCLDQSSEQNANSPIDDCFQALVFTTARTQRLTPQGILPSYRYSRSLQDIFRAIAQTLKRPSLLTGDFDRQLENTYSLLSEQRTLLIIDNLEALCEPDRAAILSFLYDLPTTVKAIITSRIQLTLDAVIPLQPLSETEAVQFTRHQATLKAISLNQTDIQALCRQTGGMPAAIVYALGQTTAGYPIPNVLPQLTIQDSDYCRYYLQGTVQSIQDQLSYELLSAIAVFPGSTSVTALIEIFQLSESSAAEVLAQLQRLALVTRTCDETPRFLMLPLTREYLLAQLAASEEDSLKEKWLMWSQSWLMPYQDLSWRAWHDYTQVDAEWENLQAVVEWCVATDKYEAFGQLWPALRGYTHLRGYWNERLGWLSWWLESAREREDAIARAEALRDLGWSLTLMGQPQQLEQADDYFAQAWQQTKSLAFQLDLAIEHVVLRLIQNRLVDALKWLEISEKLLQQSQLNPETESEQRTRIRYYTAQLYYHQKKYQQAKSLYHELLAQAQTKTDQKSQQTRVYILNWLVDIALQQAELDEAEQLLAQSWPVIQDVGDVRSQAFHQRSRAQLEKQRGHVSEYQRWSEQAKLSFEKLGMTSQIKEMETWLAE
ncbi:MAG: AAA family ATPase, partial [Cyanobacteria bacterium J06621_11]